MQSPRVCPQTETTSVRCHTPNRGVARDTVFRLAAGVLHYLGASVRFLSSGKRPRGQQSSSARGARADIPRGRTLRSCTAGP